MTLNRNFTTLQQNGLFALCYGLCFGEAWIIIFYMMMNGGFDSEHCYVTEGELWVSQTPTGASTEYDIAAEYRKWFMWAFFVYIGLFVFPVLHGICFLIGGTRSSVDRNPKIRFG